MVGPDKLTDDSRFVSSHQHGICIGCLVHHPALYSIQGARVSIPAVCISVDMLNLNSKSIGHLDPFTTRAHTANLPLFSRTL